MGRRSGWMLGLVIAVLAAQPAAASEGLAGEWLLDETAGETVPDTSGAGNNGRLGSVDGPDANDPTRIPGRFGGALHFDGDDFVALPDTRALEPTHMTIEAWFRRAGTPGQYRYIISKGGATCETSSYGMYSGPGGGLAFYVSDGVRYVLSPEVGESAVWDGNWHHAAGLYDGQNVRLYFDGAQVGDGTPTTLSISYGLASKAAFLGLYRGTCDLPFSGDLDLLRIWSVPLAPADIADSLRGQRPSPSAPPGTADPGSTTVAVGGQGGASARCFAVRADRRTLKRNRRARLRVTVRDRGRPVAGARVLVRGRRTSISAVTDRKGRARLVIRPRTRSRLSVRVKGRPMKCRAPRITVRS